MMDKNKLKNLVILLAALIVPLGSSTPMGDVRIENNSGMWSVGGRDFVVNQRGFHLLSLQTKLPVMVSFKPGSNFSRVLRQHPGLVAYFSSHSGVGRALIAANSPGDVDQLALQAHEDIGACGAIERFNPHLSSTPLPDASSPVIATSVRAAEVTTLTNEVSASNIKETISMLENLGTRHHSITSPDVSAVVEGLWQPLLPSGTTINKVSHNDVTQKSVVVRIPGTDISAKTIILGAHLDSINPSNNQDAPGADDDASGIAALTEVLRIIKTSGATFTRSIELHAYAAEEVGLVGSQGLANAATASNRGPAAMLQLDMIGYSADPNDNRIHIITTDTSPILVRHLKDLTSNYLGSTGIVSELTSGTSDHRSWHRAGFHVAFAFENPGNYNRALHTASDKSDRLNFNLAARFTKLALAFLAHEAGLSTGVGTGNSAWAQQQATAGDIKMAISKSKAGGYRISAAVPKSLNAQTAELCRVSNGTERGCQNLVTTAPLAKNQFEKTFFVSESDLPLSAGHLWRMHVYDSVGGLVALRTVKLQLN